MNDRFSTINTLATFLTLCMLTCFIAACSNPAAPLPPTASPSAFVRASTPSAPVAAPTRASTPSAPVAAPTRASAPSAPVAAPTRASAPTVQAAPILDAQHPGWKTQTCTVCHATLSQSHTVRDPSACAQCHGGNGACAASAATTLRHAPTDNCVLCHQNQHGFAQPTQCAACHFAGSGTVPCTAASGASGAALAPASALKSDCLNLPRQDPSPTNHARVVLGLAAGEPAVDFALQDVNGRLHTLSDLLAAKPVLLVLGGYT